MNEQRRTCPVCQIESKLRCTRCKSVWYCSPQHQKDDWSIHKLVCKIKSSTTNSHAKKILRTEDMPELLKTFLYKPSKDEVKYSSLSCLILK